MSDTSIIRQEGANPQALYYPALDGIRAVAVLMVFLVHYASLHFPEGWMGVNIFFVLSGFLITGILFDSRDKTHRFSNFYIRRTLRIFPLFYAVWLALLILTPVLHISWRSVNLFYPFYIGNFLPLIHPGPPLDSTILHIIANPFHDTASGTPLYIYTGHFWSLCVEEQFYLVWPLVVFLVGKRSTLVKICIAVLIISPLLRVVFTHLLPYPWNNGFIMTQLTFLRLDEFLAGGLGALILRGPRAAWMQSIGSRLFIIGLAAMAGSYLFGRFVLHLPSEIFEDWRWVGSCGITFIDITSLGMILMCLDARNWFSRLMNLAPLRALGKIAYGFYVFHDIPHLIYDHLENQYLGMQNHHAIGLLIPFTGTLMLAIPSYYFLERPFLRLKTRFEGHRTRHA